jgi:hypothetical protein
MLVSLGCIYCTGTTARCTPVAGTLSIDVLGTWKPKWCVVKFGPALRMDESIHSKACIHAVQCQHPPCEVSVPPRYSLIEAGYLT